MDFSDKTKHIIDDINAKVSTRDRILLIIIRIMYKKKTTSESWEYNSKMITIPRD